MVDYFGCYLEVIIIVSVGKFENLLVFSLVGE